MTNYEKRVEEGTLEAMNGTDWMMLGCIVEGIIDEKDIIDEEICDLVIEMKDEIDFYYKDLPEILKQLEIKIKTFKENGGKN